MDKNQLKTIIPDYVLDVARILKKEHFEAYLVGGSLRDIAMGRQVKDYDIGTDALAKDIVNIFPKAIATGAKFGSIIVLMKDEQGETQHIDVTTYRIDEQYIHGRWPSKVIFTRSINEDLSRRDFTWNAMALELHSLQEGVTNAILLDPFGGQKDIKLKVVRSVGNAAERMKEDALRALRACRFASVLGFELDNEVFTAIKNVLPMIDNLSAERVREEFLKILYNSSKPSVGLKLLKETGILKIWIPELLEGVGVDQPLFHAYDVFEHSLRTVDIADDSVKLAALFHDIGKPRTKKGKHFYRHDVVGYEMTRNIMNRLRFSKKEIDRVSRLVRWHMFYFPYDEEAFMKGKELGDTELEKGKKILQWGDAAIRRFVKNVGGEDAVDDLFMLRIADATANPKGLFDPHELEALEQRISEVRQKDMALKVSDLDINGHDLQELGIPSSPKLGNILHDLIEIVIEDPTKNDKKTLISIVKERYLEK